MLVCWRTQKLYVVSLRDCAAVDYQTIDITKSDTLDSRIDPRLVSKPDDLFKLSFGLIWVLIDIYFQCSSWVVSGSRRLATNSKVYELRIYSTHNPVALKKALEFSAKALPIRFSVSPALGYFISEIGALNETVHIWEYGKLIAIEHSLHACSMTIAMHKDVLRLLSLPDGQFNQ